MSLLETINAIGLLAARPAAAAANEGYSYHATDEGITYRSNGASWVDVAINEAGHAAVDHTGLPGVGGGAAAFAGVRVRAVADVPLTSGSIVYLTFDTEDYDTDGFHDGVTNPSRLTVPTGLGGKFAISASSLTTSSPGAGFCVFRVNGTTIIAAGPLNESTSSGQAALATDYALAAADYVEFGIRVGASSKSAIDGGVADPVFCMHKTG